MTKTLVLQRLSLHLPSPSLVPTPTTTCRIRAQTHPPISRCGHSLSQPWQIRKCTMQMSMQPLSTATIELPVTSLRSQELQHLPIRLQQLAKQSPSPTSQSQELMLETTPRTPVPLQQQRSHKGPLKLREHCRHKTRSMTVLALPPTTLQT